MAAKACGRAEKQLASSLPAPKAGFIICPALPLSSSSLRESNFVAL